VWEEGDRGLGTRDWGKETDEQDKLSYNNPDPRSLIPSPY
jgi:hypothetical protein